jgi:tetratricopeptide (TPR) repeat protein
MKQYFIRQVAVSLVAGVTLWGCGNQLNVDPVQSVPEDKALQTASDVKGALVGCYDGFGSNNFASGAIQYTPDLLADDGEIRFNGTFATLLQYYQKAMLANNTQVRDTWTSAYSTINRVNNVLENLSKLDTDAERAAAEGEALFLRGTIYFNLVRLFARTWGDGDNTVNPGVPLVLKSTKAPITSEYSIPRNTVAQVYTQVIADLTKAETDLKNGKLTTDGVTAEGAAAILSRVYLAQGEYAKARDAADRVIQSGRYALEIEFGNVFNDYVNRKGVPSREAIFSSLITIQDGTNDLLTYYGASDYGGRGDIRVQSKHLAQYEQGDIRGAFFYQGSNGQVYTQKYIDQFSNVTQVRLAEMYLTRAEGNLLASTQVGDTPLNDVNLIRERAGLAPLKTADRAAILKERKLELMFEGELLHDLRRTKRNISSSVAYNAPNLILPIPQREIDVNKLLVQNQGY